MPATRPRTTWRQLVPRADRVPATPHAECLDIIEQLDPLFPQGIPIGVNLTNGKTALDILKDWLEDACYGHGLINTSEYHSLLYAIEVCSK